MNAQQLKNSILQYAMQGKLVPQDPNDKPATELVLQIRKEKEQLIQQKVIKEDKPLLPISDEEIPFDIPDNWSWVRHNELFEIIGGSQPSKSYFSLTPSEERVRLYQIRDYGKKPQPVYVPKNKVTKFTAEGDILLARYGASVGKVFIAESGAYNVAMARIKKLFLSEESVNNKFMYYFYLSALYQQLVRSIGRSAQAGFNKADLNSLLMPLPPAKEQLRIVVKIEEMFNKIDSFDLIEKELNKVNNEFPIKLKNSILNYAMQGKLAEQDSNDEPANELVKRINEEKKRLIQQKVIKKEKPLSPISDEELPFDIPESWEWVRLGEVINLVSGQDFPPDKYNHSRIGTPYITGASTLTKEGVLLNRWTETPQSIAELGDLLLVCKGSGYGKTLICNVESAHIARQIMAIRKSIYLNTEFIDFYLQSNFSLIKKLGQGVIPGIDRKNILNLLLPLPPLKEQNRIVVKIKENYSLLNKLQLN